MARGSTKIPYWILVNPERNCVWHEFFFTHQRAQARYGELIQKHGKCGWIAEKHWTTGTKEDLEMLQLAS